MNTPRLKPATTEGPGVPPAAEGDINASPRRAAWQADALDAETRAWLAEDARWFLHQSLSTPCLNVLRACRGAEIEDLQGRAHLDFHGNSVHQAVLETRA